MLKNSEKVNQSGRSTVEIIAVLIVAGVLTVSSLLGYQLLMKQHKRNESVDIIVKVATAARTGMITEKYGDEASPFKPKQIHLSELISGVPLSEDGYSLKTPDGTIVRVNVLNKNAMELELKGVSQKTCEGTMQSDSMLYGARTADQDMHEVEKMENIDVKTLCAEIVAASEAAKNGEIVKTEIPLVSDEKKDTKTAPSAVPVARVGSFAPVESKAVYLSNCKTGGISYGYMGGVSLICGVCYDSSGRFNTHTPYQDKNGTWGCCPNDVGSVIGNVCCASTDTCDGACCFDSESCMSDQNTKNKKRLCCPKNGYNIDGKCVECLTDSDCENEFCNTDTNMCVECLNNYGSDLPAPCSTLENPVCDNRGSAATFTCGQCPEGKVFDEERAMCVNCYIKNSDHIGCSDGRVCDVAANKGLGQCVTCLEDPDNRPCIGTAFPYCLPVNKVLGCRECKTDVDCTDPTRPTCDVSTYECKRCADAYPETPYWNKGQCVRCYIDGNTSVGCTGGMVCDEALDEGRGVCMPCLLNPDNRDCTTPLPFCLQDTTGKRGCHECNTDPDCIALNNPAKVACLWQSNEKVCVDCKTAYPGKKEYYDPATKTCVQCLEDAHCKGDTPYCDPSTKQCGQCPTGLYWNDAKQKCVECLENYGKGEGACGTLTKPVCNQNPSKCEACPAGYEWDVGLDKCVCEAGTYDKGGVCVECLGDYGTGTGSCPNIKVPVCNPGKSECEACPAGKEWSESDKACVCKAGTFPKGNKCVQCLVNYGSTAMGPCTTTAKPICNQTTNICEVCPGNRQWDTSSNSCVCKPNYHGANCTYCMAPGEWKNNACVCSGGRTWNGTTCVCPSGQTWNGTSCINQCTGGQTWNGSSCVCPSGTNWIGKTQSCQRCSNGYSASSQRCLSCNTGGSLSVNQPIDHEILTRMYSRGGNCYIAVAGKYKDKAVYNHEQEYGPVAGNCCSYRIKSIACAGQRNEKLNTTLSNGGYSVVGVCSKSGIQKMGMTIEVSTYR